jgi:conjugal transfer mating pair stabilization protein TraN
MPGVSRVVCNQNYSPTLLPSACQPNPLTSPPYTSETFINGCAPYEALLASSQAVLVSQVCTDTADRVMACNDYTGVDFLMPTYNWFSSDHHPGMWYGYYSINYGQPTPDGAGGYNMQFSISGNATGENKYGCTNGTYGGGTWLMSPGQTISYGGSPPYCNSKCSCWGAGVTFTLGAITWTTPTSFSIPFSYSFGGVAAGTIQIMGGLRRNAYTVSPLTGCWQTTFEYDIQTQIPDSCQPYRDAGCNQTNSVCSQFDPLSGTCQVYTNTFQCAGGQVCSKWQDNFQCNSCGTPGSLVPFCMPTSSPPNTNFQQAATMMALVKEVENGFDKDTLRIFTGTPKRCDYSTIGTIIIDCCSDDPSRMLGNCSDEEVSLASDKKANEVIYVGTRCVEWVNGGLVKICTRKEDTYCTFTSMLGRMVQQQGKPQLGMNFGTPDLPDCDGFTLNEFASLNFQAMNWSEFIPQIVTSYDASSVAATMRTKACAMNGQTC